MRRQPRSTFVCAMAILFALSAASHAEELSLEKRIEAQRAIEQVYWNHRTWPDQNPGAKPSLESVLPDSAIRAKVEDSLKLSSALDTLWDSPVTADQLQAELTRMRRDSRQPEVLQEIFDALGNDPAVAAECLARPALVSRTVRDLYSRDERFHGGLRRKVEAALARARSAGGMKRLGGDYRETEWKIGARTDDENDLRVSPTGRLIVTIDAADWDTQVAELGQRFGPAPQSRVSKIGNSEKARTTTDSASSSIGEEDLPIGCPSALQETQDAFFVTAVLSRAEGSITTATVSWPKAPFDVWWSETAHAFPTVLTTARGSYPPLSRLLAGCTYDTWSRTRFLPSVRSQHVAVWTGSEMLVWGGTAVISSDQGGGRYNPATDSWTPMSVGTNAQIIGRTGHTAVWTGTEMIIWGGLAFGFPSARVNTGGRYNPTSDTWTPTGTGTDVPLARSHHTAVWTGSRMIVWGGWNGGAGVGGLFNSGGRYDPTSDTWSATQTLGSAAARTNHTSIWTGSVMVVWGGRFSATNVASTGGRYDPVSNSWATTASAPSASQNHSAVWNPSSGEMIVWGGIDSAGASLNSGGRYNVAGNSWTATPTIGAPAARSFHTAVWSTSTNEMIVWGGTDGTNALSTGGEYNPGTNSWSATGSGANLPSARSQHTAVWTGSEMIVWGGAPLTATGGRYNPSGNSWLATAAPTVPEPRNIHTLVWTGAEMIAYGGQVLSDPVQISNTGYRYTPATDTWTSTFVDSVNNERRGSHTALWTGTEMIVWGGIGASLGDINTGSRYNPVTDQWNSVSTGPNTPSARHGHAAVWTGSEMIIWGGFTDMPEITGARYSPSGNSWTATSTGANVPSPRSGHRAVWSTSTSEMIVWSGFDGGGNPLNTGSRYSPAGNSWLPMSTGANVPSGRVGFAAVWTGSEMIVFAGTDSINAGSGYLNTGGRYKPTTDSWMPTSVGANVPTPRTNAMFAWTGTELFAWGGVSGAGVYPNDGGRYNPAGDFWLSVPGSPTSPSGRNTGQAVAAGERVIVWGGGQPNCLTNSGGLYCHACAPMNWYRDGDNDGYGASSGSVSSCGTPPGYVTIPGDCNDAAAGVHPGAVELCDLADNDCDGSVDNAAPPSEIPKLAVSKPSGNQARVEWEEVERASGYDLVSGSLFKLAESFGDFTSATQACLLSNVPTPYYEDNGSSPFPDALWFLARARNCGGVTTYDSGGTGQVGSRDQEIAASPHACP